MSDIEFEVLDQLYLTNTLNKLASTLTQYNSVELIDTLKTLHAKEWIKVIDISNDDEVLTHIQWNNLTPTICFLATKKGLMVHNSK
jgi:hypothetical protein